MRAIGLLSVVLLIGAAATQEGLRLDPASGPPGTAVTAPDLSCAAYEVTDDDGRLIGAGDADAPVPVTFTVSDDAEPGDYDVVVACLDGDGPETHAGTFTVDGTSSTTTSGVPTTTTRPSTTTETLPDGNTTTTSVPPPVPETIDECREQAGEALGRLAYEPRRRMVVGHAYDLRAVLSLDAVPPDITFESPTTIEEVPHVQCTVEAHLTGSDFEITPAEPKKQSFIGTRTLLWEWQVRPRRAGDDLELTLRLQAEVVEDGPPVPGPTILHESTIDVSAEPVSWWTSFTRWLEDVFGHPAVPILIVPLVGAAIAYGRRRLRADKPARPEPGDGLA